MLYKTVHTWIPIISVNTVFLRGSSSAMVSRFARDVLTTRLTGCNSTPQHWDGLITDVSRGTTYDLEALIASLSNDEDYQPQFDAFTEILPPHE